jgi:hypothetical protein
MILQFKRIILQYPMENKTFHMQCREFLKVSFHSVNFFNPTEARSQSIIIKKDHYFLFRIILANIAQ